MDGVTGDVSGYDELVRVAIDFESAAVQLEEESVLEKKCKKNQIFASRFIHLLFLFVYETKSIV